MKHNPGKEQELSKTTLHSIEREEKIERIKQETEQDLRTNPKYKAFFSKYRKDSVESFISSYALEKAHALTHGEFYVKKEEDIALKYKNLASECLWEIQYKKLFDLQCRWRAEQEEIKEVESTLDFDYWFAAIKKCPFLPPITEDEVDLYISYLISDDVYDHWLYQNWNNYDEIRESYNNYDPDNCDPIPPWYEFYDTRMGTGAMLILPDTRGEKEQFYEDIWREKVFEKKLEETAAKQAQQDNRPYLSRWGEDQETFIRKFEDPYVYRCCLALQQQLEKNDNKLQVDVALITLDEADEIVPIEGDPDWREAIIRAAKKYNCRQIVNALPAAYTEYNMRLSAGIAFEESEKELEEQKEALSWVNDFKSQILTGRKLNGEPEDFNF